ncbi:hypothetical protein Tco_0938403 [Tanacetum coccineum]|uniref:Uncharacterized protein n=1 Tax=Tanacetum coccineum TaxID=301880 RepID=A0ABQ5DIY6_9ASTR
MLYNAWKISMDHDRQDEPSYKELSDNGKENKAKREEQIQTFGSNPPLKNFKQNPEDTDNAHFKDGRLKSCSDQYRKSQIGGNLKPGMLPFILMIFSEPENNWAMYSLQLSRSLGETNYLGRLVIWDSSSNVLDGRKIICCWTNEVDWLNPEGHQILRNDLDYLLSGDKEQNSALLISKLKAAHYQDFGLEVLVPSLWIKSEREYDISEAYGITYWWFKRKEFYINKHCQPSDRDASYAELNEYKIAEKDFKNLHPNDFEDLNILHLQGKLDHLPKQDKVHLHNAVNLWTRNIIIRKRVEDLQLGIESYQTKLNLEQPNRGAFDFLYKEDYIIVSKPRAVIYRDRNDQKKMTRLSEVHKFSDGTLMRIRDKLAFMVKDFRVGKDRTSEWYKGTYNADGNPARANIKQALGLHKVGDAESSLQPHVHTQPTHSKTS